MSSISGWIPKIWDDMGLSENETAKKYPMCISISPMEISACYDSYVVPIPHFQTHPKMYERLVPNGLDNHGIMSKKTVKLVELRRRLSG